MTLVKSLYSGDPDVIRNTRTSKVPDVHSGLQHLQGLFGLLPRLSPYAWHMHCPCSGLNVVIDDGQVDAPNSQLISCLDSSMGRASACGAGGRRFAPRL
jgi:hypothetical protein